MDNFGVAIDGVVQNTNVIGIAFNLIVIRTAAKSAEEEETREHLTTIHFNSKPVSSVQYTASVGTGDATMYP
jgi:hypothetical protein